MADHCWHVFGRAGSKRLWRCCHCGEFFSQGPDKKAISEETSRHGKYLPIKQRSFALDEPLPTGPCKHDS